ncbi:MULTISPECIES: DUF2840 domain-containing protein [Bradyrhizobium]|uniref:DUF2840 domain-containing protein n=1 Tax=Bradyrhizobium TaxID=374 RepID=UPI00222682AF|nr:DUF2840 domain-containing protein [Bradyrhizobium sp. Mp19]MCW2359850.1 hypothetical protein [Bradyrhizobium elkanii]MDI2054433.1 DUF2840 domain-containing protein [Bradyrhizobium sp. Mp19]
MTGGAAIHARGEPRTAAPPPHVLTEVELTWIEKRIENWIRFGREVGEQILDRRRRVLRFAPDSVFGFVRWAANDYGTIASHLDVLRATRGSEPQQTMPFVRPGGEILLRVEGWPKVERVLQVIDAIEAIGIDPSDVSPDHWRHVHNRLSVGEQPRSYTVQHHKAFLLRRRAAS